MLARLYTIEQRFLLECTAFYRPNEGKLYLRIDENIEDMGPGFLVHYTDSNLGVFDFRCSYDGYEREGTHHYLHTLVVVETIKTVQRRSDIKVKINLPIKIILLDTGDRVKIHPETGKTMEIRAYLRDISAGGLLIETDSHLDVNQRLLIPFDKGSMPLLLNAEVLRENYSTGDYQVYGCRFYNLNSGKEAVIRGYVFRLQLANKDRPTFSPDA